MTKLSAVRRQSRHAPYPLSWEEQNRLFRELPAHLQRIALYKVNTSCRKREVLQIRWNWEVQVPKAATCLFVLPNDDEFATKGSQERYELRVLSSLFVDDPSSNRIEPVKGGRRQF